jgi:uncharacterized repeat protein (TIGR03803 family)
MDGENPNAGLVRDTAGNLFGTTVYGGSNGHGTVFELDTTGKETLLYTFTGGSDGGQPIAGLLIDAAGNLYGTTSLGGTFNGGTVFKIDTSGNETVLHRFGPAPDGGYPYSGLVMDPAGNLYGTTLEGGLSDNGVVFKLDVAGNETVLYSFCSLSNCLDGSEPFAGLTMDATGNLYGTTGFGGAYNNGTVFQLDTTGSETVMYSFEGGADGSVPYAGLILDSAHDLYGTTPGGGASNLGTVFELNASGIETVLHSFLRRE